MKSKSIEKLKNANYVYDNYFFPEETDAIVNRIDLARNIFISGHSGTGKSEFFLKLAKLFNRKIVKVNFNFSITEQHLIGRHLVEGNDIVFHYGIIPEAMKNGWWLLLDEIDYAQPEHLSALQSVLDGQDLLVTQNKNETIKKHKDFRLFATANTKGRGDDTMIYTGTNFLNAAFLDRWSIFEFDYNTEAEEEMIKKILSEDKNLQLQILKLRDNIRRGIEANDIDNSVFSTRRLLSIIEMFKFGERLSEIMNYELIQRFNKTEQDKVWGFVYDVWDRKHYKNWKMGDDHIDFVYDSDENSLGLKNLIVGKWYIAKAMRDILIEDIDIKKNKEIYIRLNEFDEYDVYYLGNAKNIVTEFEEFDFKIEDLKGIAADAIEVSFNNAKNKKVKS